MTDLDSLLKQFEQPKKPTKKENPSQQQKLPIPNLSAFPKYDLSNSDNRKGNIPNPNFSFATEQHRTSILKQPSKPSVEQSFDIDAILHGHSMQPQQSSKVLHPIAPTKDSVSSARRDSLTDWLNEDRSTTKNHPNQPLNLFPQKVTTNVTGKPVIDLNSDEFFSNTNNRDQSGTKGTLTTTKPSAKQYYLGNTRYKPGKNFDYFKRKT
jgi:hypothetical protein